MKFKRRFTKTKGQPYAGIRFEERASELRNADGSQASTSLKVKVPSSWSQVATDILAQKYLRKAGVPTIGSESDARQVFHRVAGCWTEWGRRHHYFDSEGDAAAFYDECCYMLAHQMAAPNSPQWFNTGLFYAYGIKGPSQGHYFVDPESKEVKRSPSAYQRPQPHACFIQSIRDDLVGQGGLMDLWTREARLFKYGSGTGTNFSQIRAAGEPLSGGGVSSGLMSFLKIGDRAAGAIKSGGTTRRAAKMVCLDVDHPDVLEFINWKVAEEQKVVALVAGSKAMEVHLNAIARSCQTTDETQASIDALDPTKNAALKKAIRAAHEAHIPLASIQRVLDLAKQNTNLAAIEVKVFDTDWNSEAYATVSGQNSNNSVRVTAAFMNAVAADGDWELVRRTDGRVVEKMKARTIWDQICQAAWASADPGLQFDTTINEWNTCPKDGRINASNPCSEYMFLDDTACNLASLNLMKFYDEDSGKLDVEGYRHACRIWTVVLDISVQMAQFPSREIAQRSWDYRTLGLGYANLGALLMKMAIPYGSPAAQAYTGTLSAIMGAECYRTSAEMAKELGAFPRYEANRGEMLRVIRNHRRAAHGDNSYEGLTITPQAIDARHCPDILASEARIAWDQALALGEKYGFRNAQVTAIAPTGTIGLLMDCDTTGIEPDYALVKFKKLAGGGYFKIINQSVPTALKKLGYSESQTRDIIRYCNGHGSLDGCPVINRESLREKGFGEDLLDRLEGLLASAFDISFVFNQWTVGADFCREILKIDPESSGNLLQAIGFSETEIRVANEWVCGTMTLEGAPHLRDEHLSIFDCANKCGSKGQRFISADGHIDMMAAAQPFVSGAISKTINLPNDASVGDIEASYLKSWRKMLKANAVYRDGSKLSQPLNTNLETWTEILTESKTTNEKVIKIAERAAREWVDQRRRLPHKRNGYTQKVKMGGHTIYIRTGEYRDGQLGEIFLDINKEGTLLRSMMNCFAISVSLGLQYGVPLEEFVDVFTFARFEPNGPVAGHDNIRRATSIIDLLFRDLAANYLDRYDLVHVPPEDMQGPSEKVRETAFAPDITSGRSVSRESVPRESVSRESPENQASLDISAPSGEQGNAETTSAGVPPPSPLAISEVRPIDSGALAISLGSRAVPVTYDEEKFNEFAQQYAEARLRGYEGDPCPDCGTMTLVRNGSCLKCESCGSTTGCS